MYSADSFFQWTAAVLLTLASTGSMAADLGRQQPSSGVGAEPNPRAGARLAGATGFDHCFDHHAGRFGLDAELLRGVARVESGMRPGALNNSHVQRTGTRDIGLMQINSSLLPGLASYGITERDLMDPCTNIEVGAWVLSDAMRRLGDSWAAVGAYNAACSQLKGQACTDARSRYAWAVYKRMGSTPARQPAVLQVAAVPPLAAATPTISPSGGLVRVTLASTAFAAQGTDQ